MRIKKTNSKTMVNDFDLSDFEFSSASQLAPKMKATVHKNGTLGFNSDAIQRLKIKEGMGIRLGKSKISPDPLHLLMKLSPIAESEDFKINKAGSYYYVRTKPYFDHLELQYGEGRIIYDLRIKGESDSVVWIEMNGRRKKKKIT